MCLSFVLSVTGDVPKVLFKQHRKQTKMVGGGGSSLGNDCLPASCQTAKQKRPLKSHSGLRPGGACREPSLPSGSGVGQLCNLGSSLLP